MKSQAGIGISNSFTRNHPMTTLRWGFIVLFGVATLLDGLNLGFWMLEPIAKMLIFVTAWFHGSQRYGRKNMLIWLGIVWLVSNFFESMSIATGFPFGYYHYEIPGPRIANVPVLIMPAYFGMGYIAWTIAQILTSQYNQRLAGVNRYLVPFIAAFIMTAYDVVTDPIASTVNSRWIWRDGGVYFGVPLSNFAGWLIVVFCFQQLFAWYISRHQVSRCDARFLNVKAYWLEPVIIFLIMGLLPVTQFFTHSDHVEIFGSMALVSVFTMVLIAMFAYLALRHNWSRREE